MKWKTLTLIAVLCLILILLLCCDYTEARQRRGRIRGRFKRPPRLQRASQGHNSLKRLRALKPRPKPKPNPNLNLTPVTQNRGKQLLADLKPQHNKQAGCRHFPRGPKRRRCFTLKNLRREGHHHPSPNLIPPPPPAPPPKSTTTSTTTTTRTRTRPRQRPRGKRTTSRPRGAGGNGLDDQHLVSFDGFDRPFKAHFQAVADGFSSAIWSSDYRSTNVSVFIDPDNVKCPKLDGKPHCASTYAENECWAVDQPDVDCEDNALCCFNGCENVCFYGFGQDGNVVRKRAKKVKKEAPASTYNSSPSSTSGRYPPDGGQCPAVRRRRRSSCRGSRPNCWSAGSYDLDCPDSGLCCFDGCSNRCVEDRSYSPPSKPEDEYRGTSSKPPVSQVSYEAPKEIDSYGAPVSPPSYQDLDEYGAPQAPSYNGGNDLDEYGSPPSPSYNAPSNQYQAPPSTSYNIDTQYEAPPASSYQEPENSYGGYRPPVGQYQEPQDEYEQPEYNESPQQYNVIELVSDYQEPSSGYSSGDREPTLILHIYGPPETVASVLDPNSKEPVYYNVNDENSGALAIHSTTTNRPPPQSLEGGYLRYRRQYNNRNKKRNSNNNHVSLVSIAKPQVQQYGGRARVGSQGAPQRCPVVGKKSVAECELSRPECRNPNEIDSLCRGAGEMCCYDGCTYKCGLPSPGLPEGNGPVDIPLIIRRSDSKEALNSFDDLCPAEEPLPKSQCKLRFRHECHKHADCYYGSTCCFDGCANVCRQITQPRAQLNSNHAEDVTGSGSGEGQGGDFAESVHTALRNYFYGQKTNK